MPQQQMPKLLMWGSLVIAIICVVLVLLWATFALSFINPFVCILILAFTPTLYFLGKKNNKE